jgi:hypothetical protein
MPDPRNIVGFEGIDEVFVTFLTDNVTILFDATLPGRTAAATLNKAVSLSAGSTVQLTNNTDSVIGKLILVESDLKCSVQVEGCCTLPGGRAATLTLGTHIVGATGAAAARGFIRTAVASESPLQTGQIWDATDPTAVIVAF